MLDTIRQECCIRAQKSKSSCCYQVFGRSPLISPSTDNQFWNTPQNVVKGRRKRRERQTENSTMERQSAAPEEEEDVEEGDEYRSVSGNRAEWVAEEDDSADGWSCELDNGDTSLGMSVWKGCSAEIEAEWWLNHAEQLKNKSRKTNIRNYSWFERRWKRIDG